VAHPQYLGGAVVIAAPLLAASAGALGLLVGFMLRVAVYRDTRRSPNALGVRYPLAEVGTAALFAAVAVRFGPSVEMPAYLYLVSVGVALTLIDFNMRRLPDSVILPSYVLTVVLLMPAGATAADWHAALRALAGTVALLTLFFALALAYPNGLDFGDVKLAGLVGLYLGWLSWNALFVTAVGTLVIACFGGVMAVLTKHATRNFAVPLGPCLVSAAVLALFVTAPISNWYGSLLPV
jgi:leader peptidase (prepilin peptidase) / N-methyltransferase